MLSRVNLSEERFGDVKCPLYNGVAETVLHFSLKLMHINFEVLTKFFKRFSADHYETINSAEYIQWMERSFHQI